MYLFVLGRQAEISLAELVAIFGKDKIISRGEIAFLKTPRSINPQVFNRLGGTVKVAKVISYSWNNLISFLPKEGKVTVGLSSYNTSLKPRDLTQFGVALKKTRGSVRLLPTRRTALSSATTFHNKLDKGDNRFEFILSEDNGRQILAQVVFVQDINTYAIRDRNRPKRDAKNGMLPPKLAQIIINLATGSAKRGVLLDPFCGTGVVLLESALMGFSPYGSDYEPRMVDYSKENLTWLASKQKVQFYSQVEVGDATVHRWQPRPDFVASEAYLGTPYASEPKPEKLRENIQTCNLVIEKSLINLAKQLKPGTSLCIAVPAWLVKGKTYRLPVTRKLKELGYEAKLSRPLIYRRKGQIVGRDLLLLKKR